MTPRPYRLALLLAAATLAGLVGTMVLDGWWQALFYVLATLPVFGGLACFVKANRRPSS